MTVDYNIVILGGGEVARHAARYAKRWGARVALVEPPQATITLEALQQITAYLLTCPPPPTAAPLERLREAAAFAAWQAEQTSAATLAAQGIDVVAGPGSFVDSPRGVRVGDRILRGRRYLVAVASTSSMANDLHQLPQSQIAVWGAGAQALSLAQALQRLGFTVTLGCSAPRLLPTEDPAIGQLLQAQLEAEGVRTVTSATLIPQDPGAGGQIRAEALTVAVDRVISLESFRPVTAALNLPAQVKTRPGVQVNPRLQTAHPYIYACGYALGHQNEAAAIAEAEVAVGNALSFPYRRVNYKAIPRIISTNPIAVGVGLTPQQAQRHPGTTVLTQPLSPLPQWQARHGSGQPPAGLCRVVLSRRGKLLGLSAVGPGADEWTAPLQWAMRRGIPLSALPPKLSLGGQSLHSAVVTQLAEQWRDLKQPAWQRDAAELILNWQRDWTR
ncbi:MAG: FAD-dependent oxidoreductase [Cyanobacteria bacterium P01_A01_bin.135]